MRIVLLVTGIAIRRRISVFGLRLMTALALRLLWIGMSCLEREVRAFMVERLVRNRRNILGPALVFGVAFLALTLFLEPAVGSLLLLDILSHVFVAVQTELCLCGLIESFMTFRAVVLPFRMPLDDLPRHQRRFNRVGAGGRRGDQDDSGGNEQDIIE